MRVAIVSDYLPKYHKVWSGAELIAVTLAEILKERGCEVFFLCTPFDQDVYEKEYEIYPIPTPFKRLGPISRNFPLDFVSINHICKILKFKRPDIVHINAKYLFLPTMLASLRLKIPTIFTVPDYFIFCPTTFIRKLDGTACTSYHGRTCYECLSLLSNGTLKKVMQLIPNFLIKNILSLRAKEFNYFLKKVSSFVVLSNLSMKRLVRYGISQDMVKLIYHYRLATQRETHERIENPAVVFVGWLSEENGTDIIIKAFALVTEQLKKAKLYLVGTGKEEFLKNIYKEIERSGLQNNVVFLGRKDNEEALSIISKCDVVVIPHQWPKEFGPIILVEALALGKPVITSKIGATDEFIRNGENGFLIEEFRDPAEFAHKIEYLLKHVYIAEQMGKKGKEIVNSLLNEFSKDSIINLYKFVRSNEKENISF